MQEVWRKPFSMFLVFVILLWMTANLTVSADAAEDNTPQTAVVETLTED